MASGLLVALTIALTVHPIQADDGVAPKAIAVDGYVGTERCAECHAAEHAAWQGSHHDLAMATASPDTVLGDFNDAELTAHGITSRFFRRDGGYWVRTDGPDGAMHDYPIAYTFGWTPLQQYLIAFPGGRLQTLGLAWDSRPAADGGQRWIHLYPDETRMDHRHPLHWTGREQNWNYQCAECHSTRLEKGYDSATDSYRTSFTEIDVACEACHGPGARHAGEAQAAAAGDTEAWSKHKGLALRLGDDDGGQWQIDPATGLPRRSVPRTHHTQIETCARCHARRGRISGDYRHGQPLADSHRLSLLEPRLYFADGQIDDEVYVYGSFIQSRMHAAGVTCSDCHEPHALTLRSPGNAVCGRCHMPARYDSTEHHHHPADADGGTDCIDCHMPERTYMVVDDRADHAMRIPRPDLTEIIGTPNACTGCHTDQRAAWASAAIRDWYGAERPERPRFPTALHAAREGSSDARRKLSDLAADPAEPGIARATAIDALAVEPGPALAALIPQLAGDPDAQVRAAAARALDGLAPDMALRAGLDLLDDPIRLVRIDAAHALARLIPLEANREGRPSPLRRAIDPALAEYRNAQLANADRPEAWLNLGLLAAELRDTADAEQAYDQALRLDPTFVPGYANLADLLRASGNDRMGRVLLMEGLRKAPDDPDLSHALGLLEVRAGNLPAAIPHLHRAAAGASDNPRYGYVLALAQQGAGDLDQAIATLEETLVRHPNDRAIGQALISLNAEAGRTDSAISAARRYLSRHPDDPAVGQLFDQLRRQRHQDASGGSAYR